jgi:hypothetical protein
VTWTEGLPTLAAGAHVVPEDGACLMEYVSVLAGATFSDHPRCTDPTLAALARLVNDACTDAGRAPLIVLAPDLAAAGPAGASRTAAVVLATVQSASAETGEPAVLRRHVRRAGRRYDRVTGVGPLATVARYLDPLHRLGAARRRLEASVTALCTIPGPQRDAALRRTLAAAATAACHPRAAGPPGAGTPELRRPAARSPSPGDVVDRRQRA